MKHPRQRRMEERMGDAAVLGQPLFAYTYSSGSHPFAGVSNLWVSNSTGEVN